MTRAQILTVLNDRLTTHYPPDVVDRIQSMISGTLAELDALPPYPRASARGFHQGQRMNCQTDQSHSYSDLSGRHGAQQPSP